MRDCMHVVYMYAYYSGIIPGVTVYSIPRLFHPGDKMNYPGDKINYPGFKISLE